MNNEDEEKNERVFEANATDKAMKKHFEKAGSIEVIEESSLTGKGLTSSTMATGKPPRTNHLGNSDIGEISSTKNTGASANAGMTRDDSRTATRLLQKNWSPLIVRKYQMEGWSLFIAIICDANLNDLDEIVYDISDKARELGFMDGNIQDIRNYCGFLNDEIVKHYNSIKRGCAEGVMVCWYVDKMWVSSAYGDLMQHEKCVSEVYSIINTLPHV